MNIPKITSIAACCVVLSAPAFARDQIQVVGSSTVYPFITAAAEQFGQNGIFRTPIVESTGTGGGFKLFCEGNGEDKPDISNASRKIVESEKQSCEKNGVTDVAEIPIGYDGIVIAEKKNTVLLNLTKQQIFLALARKLPDRHGKLLDNPNQTWKDVDAALPDAPIEVYGPPPTSGTRDTFIELVMEQGCRQVPAFVKAIPDEAALKNACRLLREDGKYIESGENYNVIVEKLINNEHALGIMGYGYYEENTSKIQASKIDGVMPTQMSIESGQYGISRGLFVYIKKQHIGLIPGIAEFVQEITSENAIGPDGYMTAKGLLPLKDEERKAVHVSAKNLQKL